jgi:nucleoside-diphosphate-sugar epimerase
MLRPTLEVGFDMNVFVTGASGYIGGTVGVRLVEAGHRVRGLVRTPAKADQLAGLGIEPVLGVLEDSGLLTQEARRADAVIDAASSDHEQSAQALIAALKESGKALLHTSGSSVIADDARGNRVSEAIYDEDTPFVVPQAKQHRRAIDLAVLRASTAGVRSVVLCPSKIYGLGRGPNPHSAQIPFLAGNARKHGVVQIVGKGLNRWSNVHMDDVADLYLLALAKAPPGAFYFVENGEASFGEIGDAIASRLGLGPVEHLPAEQAAQAWGESKAFYTFGSNSRVRAKRARAELGWTPRHQSVTAWIRSEMPV